MIVFPVMHFGGSMRDLSFLLARIEALRGTAPIEVSPDYWADGFRTQSGINLTASLNERYQNEFITRPVTSYSNTGGTGNRMSSITVSTTVAWDGIANLQNVVDGNLASAAIDGPTTASAGQYIDFTFATKQFIDEFRIVTVHAGTGSTFGTWVIKASNDGVNFDTVSSQFNFLGDTGTRTYPLDLITNYGGYTIYRMEIVSYSFANDFINEFEFKIQTGATADYANGNYYEATMTGVIPSGLATDISAQGGGGASNLNERYIIPNSQLSNGKKIRLHLNGGGASFVLAGAVVGAKAASGDAYDIETGTSVPVTFNNGDTGITRAASSGFFYSDIIDFDVSALVSSGKDLVVSLGYTTATNFGNAFAGSGISLYRGGTAAAYNTENAASGYSAANITSRFMFNRIEIMRRDNLTLQTTAQSMGFVPSTVRATFMYKAMETITLGTDLKLFASRDNGTTWTEITTLISGSMPTATGWSYVGGDAIVSAQPSGSNVVFRAVVYNNKDIRFAGDALAIG